MPCPPLTSDDDLDLAPDPVIEAYKRDLDRTLLRQSARKSVEERVTALMALQRLAAEARRAGRIASRRELEVLREERDRPTG